MLQHQPAGDRAHLRRAWFLRGPSSGTTMWVQEMKNRQAIGLVRWGDTWYLPVENGTHIGIGVHNDNDFPIAVPTYVEARNIWDGGPPQPQDCKTDYMWEIKPGQGMVIDKLMNPNVQRGRPLIIVPSGGGLGIGEATFHTDEFRGMVHVYERKGERPRMRHESFRPEAYGGENLRGGATFAANTGNTKSIFPRGGASIGAGEEVHQGHHDTGLSYERTAVRIAALQMEHREDLRAALGPIADFTWSMPLPHGHWWSVDRWAPWVFGDGRAVASGVPVAPQPHRPQRY